MNLLSRAQQAKAAALKLQGLSEKIRVEALNKMAKELRSSCEDIMAANRIDVQAGEEASLSSALLDRLAIGAKHVEAMARACEEIAKAPAVVGMIEQESKRPDGLIIQKQRIPIGVIAMIFESRPNVVIDGAALAIKSGNAILLKGGKEAQHSNRALAEVIARATQGILPDGSVGLIETRDEVDELLKLNQYVDLMVPRGGEKLIRYVREKATMPVVAHDRGLCHVYLHQDADPNKALEIVLNAKTQRPGVCNAMETLLVHEKFPLGQLTVLLEELTQRGVEIHACKRTQSLLPELMGATDQDFDTEWLDLKMSVKMVTSENEAIEHIQKHGTHHTEAIISQNSQVIELFMNSIDASCIAINASTRFNDGGELGLGAELGISTSKLHAYGPMGAKEMTTTRFIVKGDGHVRK